MFKENLGIVRIAFLSRSLARNNNWQSLTASPDHMHPAAKNFMASDEVTGPPVS